MSNGDEHVAADAEVAGEVVVAVVEAVDAVQVDHVEAARDVVDASGLADATTGEWYSLPSFVALVTGIDDVVAPTETVGLGERVARTLDLPPVEGASAALAALDDVYRDVHRRTNGGYSFRQIGDDDGRVECDTPYPCPFDRGVVQGVTARATDGFVRLREVGVCREEGAPRCTYEVTW